MNNKLRYILLLPLSALYGLIISIRNWLFDIEFLRSEKTKVPLIRIGNLRVGGTGKTPHAEFILSELQDRFQVGLLSRGYKRLTKGFVLANENTAAWQIGDEPYQIYLKYKPVPVASCEDRVEGVKKLLKAHPELNLIVLDDAFQHRSIHSGLSILLTEYGHLYTRDSMLPGGDLREPKRGSKRADIIIVTKCPEDIKPIDLRLVEHEINPAVYQSLYFSSYKYQEPKALFDNEIEKNWSFEDIRSQKATILLVTGIANPTLINNYLGIYSSDIHNMKFDDHHDFGKKDMNRIEQKFNSIGHPQKLIIITEKDAARMIHNKYVTDILKKHIFVLPIKVQILNNEENSLIKKITEYVAENSGNS